SAPKSSWSEPACPGASCGTPSCGSTTNPAREGGQGRAATPSSIYSLAAIRRPVGADERYDAGVPVAAGGAQGLETAVPAQLRQVLDPRRNGAIQLLDGPVLVDFLRRRVAEQFRQQCVRRRQPVQVRRRRLAARHRLQHFQGLLQCLDRRRRLVPEGKVLA